jgi:hypothetical protein
MGGNQVYGPQLPKMPAEMEGMRGQARNYITNNLTPNAAPYNFDYNPNQYQQQAGGLLQRLAGGQNPGGGASPGSSQRLEDLFPMSGAYNDTMGMLSEGLKTGFLTDTTNLWNAKKAAYSRNLQDSFAQTANDQALSGGRMGSGTANLMADQTGKAATGLAAEMAPYDTSMIEGAANRRAGLGNLGMGMSQLFEQAMSGRIEGLGKFGQQEYANTQQMQDKGYADWLRQQPGYGPIAQMLMQYSQNYPFSGSAPTVTQPWWQSLLGGAAQGGSAAAMAAIL